MKFFKYKTGVGMVATHDDAALFVHFIPAGGGLERRLLNDKFHRLFNPTHAPEMRRGTVTADFLRNGIALPCWADGAGIAYFDRATIEQMQGFGLGPFVWAAGKLVSRMSCDPCGPGWYEPVIAPDGSEMWALGAGGWKWGQVKL
jgi:hypothetical protein